MTCSSRSEIATSGPWGHQGRPLPTRRAAEAALARSLAPRLGRGLSCFCIAMCRAAGDRLHVARIRLLRTVVGLIVAFSGAKAGGSAVPYEIRPMVAAVVDKCGAEQPARHLPYYDAALARTGSQMLM